MKGCGFLTYQRAERALFPLGPSERLEQPNAERIDRGWEGLTGWIGCWHGANEMALSKITNTELLVSGFKKQFPEGPEAMPPVSWTYCLIDRSSRRMVLPYQCYHGHNNHTSTSNAHGLWYQLGLNQDRIGKRAIDCAACGNATARHGLIPSSLTIRVASASTSPLVLVNSFSSLFFPNCSTLLG